MRTGWFVVWLMMCSHSGKHSRSVKRTHWTECTYSPPTLSSFYFLGYPRFAIYVSTYSTSILLWVGRAHATSLYKNVIRSAGLVRQPKPRRVVSSARKTPARECRACLYVLVTTRTHPVCSTRLVAYWADVRCKTRLLLHHRIWPLLVDDVILVRSLG